MTREGVQQHELDLARERIRALEDALGVTYPVPRSFGLTGKEARLLGALLKRDLLTDDQAMLALYGDRMEAESPDPQIITVFICKMRAKLKPLGIGIETHWGEGWFMPAADKARVNEMTHAERECMG